MVEILDACVCIWQYGEEELNKFFNHLNSSNQHIKFTMEKSHEEISFLDMLVKINKNDEIETDLYSKPTDSHNYLLYSLACKNVYHTANSLGSENLYKPK